MSVICFVITSNIIRVNKDRKICVGFWQLWVVVISGLRFSWLANFLLDFNSSNWWWFFYLDLDYQFLVRLLDNSDWWWFLDFLYSDWWWCLYLDLDHQFLVGFWNNSDWWWFLNFVGSDWWCCLYLDLDTNFLLDFWTILIGDDLPRLSSIHQPHCFWHLIRVSTCFWDWPLKNFNFA